MEKGILNIYLSSLISSLYLLKRKITVSLTSSDVPLASIQAFPKVRKIKNSIDSPVGLKEANCRVVSGEVCVART